jgi:hypothetical protein
MSYILIGISFSIVLFTLFNIDFYWEEITKEKRQYKEELEYLKWEYKKGYLK